MSTPRCRPMLRRAVTFLRRVCRQFTTRQRSSSSPRTARQRDSLDADFAAGDGVAEVFSRAEFAGHGAELSSAVDGAVEYDAGRSALHAEPGRRMPRCLGLVGAAAGRRWGRRTQQNQGLRQSINVNYNWAHAASDNVNMFPRTRRQDLLRIQLRAGGLHAGLSQVDEHLERELEPQQQPDDKLLYERDRHCDATGILGPEATPLNSESAELRIAECAVEQYSGLNEQQPSFSVAQTISLTETLSWIHGKHNLRFGGDYRRVHHDFLAGSNATGSFTFSGLFTEDASRRSDDRLIARGFSAGLAAGDHTRFRG